MEPALPDAHVLASRGGGAGLARVAEQCYVVSTAEDTWSGVAGFPLRAAGLHPWFVHEAAKDWLASLTGMMESDADLGVGEIGLDRNAKAPFELQTAALNAQLDLAARLGRRVSVHCVRLHGALLAALRRFLEPFAKRPRSIYLHAWSGSLEVTQELLPLCESLNLFFGACARHSKAASIAVIPRNRILVESDLAMDDDRRPEQLQLALNLAQLSVEEAISNFERFVS